MGTPGDFDRFITIQSVTTTKTGMGAPVKTYSTWKQVYASRKQSAPGIEQYVNERLITPYRWLYKIYFVTGIDETMRIVDSGIYYNILSINPVEHNTFIEIIVEKITE
jgi:head-tail adaptor